MIIRCIAIDDEPLALAQITGYIGKVPFLQLVKACPSALEALDVIATHPVDLIFADINMPDLNGMDFVKSLAKKPLIIFTTAYSEYAVESFRIDALDYLLKPFGYNDFLKSANKALRQMELLNAPVQSAPVVSTSGEETVSVNNDLYIKADYKMIRIDMSKILYIESQNEYVRIFSEDQKPVMSLLRMKVLEDKLPPEKFMRVHRSYMVNLSKITAVAHNRIIFGKDVYIPIGNQYKDKFTQYLDTHFLGKG